MNCTKRIENDRDGLQQQLRTQMLISIRWRFLFGFLFTCQMASEWRSILDSMNVSLSWTTRAALFGAEVTTGWWFLVLPSVWIGFRLIEDRWVKTLSLQALTHLRSGVLAFWLLTLYALWQPMTRLVTSVS